MKIAFTICSNNYLAQAKSLGDSLVKHNPDYSFYICLCDTKIPEIDYTFFASHVILEITELGIEPLTKMMEQYNIIELNTSIKPFAFDYFYHKYPQAEIVVYFDPDILVFNNFNQLEKELINNSALLTPHILSPIDADGFTPTEDIFTQYGTFNLGFLATAKTENTQVLLDWWKKRLAVNCFDRPSSGIFVDQLPMNLAPIFFQGMKTSNNPGLNMAPWNLHERRLSRRQDIYFVNGTYPLVFYHFSKFRFTGGEVTMTDYFSRPHQGDDDSFTSMNIDYKETVHKNGYTKFSLFPCAFVKKTSSPPKPTWFQRLLCSSRKRLLKLVK